MVDDHPVVREGVRSCLSRHEHLEIVGEAIGGIEALEKAQELLPDIVLMDINLPELNGLEATRMPRRNLPQVPVLILTVHNRNEYVLQIRRSGADGYVLKEASPEELIQAIEMVDANKSFFSSKVIQFVLDEYTDTAGQTPSARGTELSQRERDVLTRIAQGLSNKQIASALGLGVRTVETHRERIMRKLGLHTVAELTKFAIRTGLIDLG